MKTRWLALIVVALTSYVAGALTPVAFSQSAKAPKYIAFAQMKVAPGKEQAYLALESDVWKPIHRKMVANGSERSWTLYSVQSAGTGDPYNFVTVQAFDSLDQYFGLDFPKTIGEAHPGKTMDSIMQQTLGAREEVAMKVMERIDHVE
jgi:hypothetical protein